MDTTGAQLPCRKLLATSAAALAMVPLARLRGQSVSSNDEIAMGIVGCGGQGTGNMTHFLNIKGGRVVAVCDVDSEIEKFLDNPEQAKHTRVSSRVTG